jgi:hypothetical protein
MVFCFVQNFFFGQHKSQNIFFLSREVQFFFQELNIKLYDKNSESDYFFSSTKNQNIFFSNIGNQNIFLEKFMWVEIFVHMSLLNMLIYIDVLCVPVIIYFNGLKYFPHLSWFNMSDII